MVGETGFEPATPWSRTKCSTRLSHSPMCNALTVYDFGPVRVRRMYPTRPAESTPQDLLFVPFSGLESLGSRRTHEALLPRLLCSQPAGSPEAPGGNAACSVPELNSSGDPSHDPAHHSDRRR